MAVEISLRLAKEQDFNGVLEISKGIYDGKDYLPFLYHQWLKLPNKYVFVAELQDKVIGLVVAAIIDGEQTVFCQSLRIHREYRGRGCSFKIMTDLLDRVLELRPKISKARLIVNRTNPRMEYISMKLGYKAVTIRNCRRKSFVLMNNRDMEIDGNFVKKSKELHEMERKYADEFVLNQRRFEALIPNKKMAVSHEVLELMPSNAGFVFMDTDKMFTDVSMEELRRHVLPRSFSHGRMIVRFDVQIWQCNIYVNDRHAFKAQLVRQILTALEQLQNSGRNIEVKVFYSKDLDFDVQEIFEEVLGLDQAATIVHDEYVLYEKTCNTTGRKIILSRL